MMKYGIWLTKQNAAGDISSNGIWYWLDDGQPRLFDTREEAEKYMAEDMEIFADPSGAQCTAEVREYR